jgi:hypothetical protein
MGSAIRRASHAFSVLHSRVVLIRGSGEAGDGNVRGFGLQGNDLLMTKRVSACFFCRVWKFNAAKDGGGRAKTGQAVSQRIRKVRMNADSGIDLACTVCGSETGAKVPLSVWR